MGSSPETCNDPVCCRESWLSVVHVFRSHHFTRKPVVAWRNVDMSTQAGIDS